MKLETDKKNFIVRICQRNDIMSRISQYFTCNKILHIKMCKYTPDKYFTLKIPRLIYNFIKYLILISSGVVYTFHYVTLV